MKCLFFLSNIETSCMPCMRWFIQNLGGQHGSQLTGGHGGQGPPPQVQTCGPHGGLTIGGRRHTRLHGGCTQIGGGRTHPKTGGQGGHTLGLRIHMYSAGPQSLPPQQSGGGQQGGHPPPRFPPPQGMITGTEIITPLLRSNISIQKNIN